LGIKSDNKDDVQRLVEVVTLSFEEFDVSFGVEAAQKYGEKFVWPPDACEDAGNRFRILGRSITRLAQALFEESELNRLNGTRVSQLRKLDPHPDEQAEAD